MSTQRKIVISLEGSIGVGKSTLLKMLKEKYQSKVIFVDEPVNIWTNIKNNDGKNLLETFYTDMKRYAYTFQNIAYITRMKLLLEALKNDNIHVIISERSLDGDKNTFTKMLHEDGCINELEMSCYHEWSNFFAQEFSSNIDFYHIFLTCQPQTSFERIHKRNRTGEESIPLVYLTRLQKCHEDWLQSKENKENTLIFDVNEDFTKGEDERLQKVSKFIEKFL